MKALTMKNPSGVWTAEASRGSGRGIWADADGSTVLGQVLGTAVGCAAFGLTVYLVLALLDLVQSWALARIAAGVAF